MPAPVWSIEDLHRFPDDGNKYEVVRGELFVTPPPAPDHEHISARLTALLVPYVVEQDLGLVYSPSSVVRWQDSQVQPDLMVRRPWKGDWNDAPTPLLVVEIGSPSTWRRDRGPKRELYAEARVPTYWMVDPETRTLSVVEGERTAEYRGSYRWMPKGASAPLEIAVGGLFD